MSGLTDLLFGGGGSNNANRQANLQEEARKQAARNRINAIFGIPPDAAALAAEKVPGGRPAPATLVPATTKSTYYDHGIRHDVNLPAYGEHGNLMTKPAPVVPATPGAVAENPLIGEAAKNKVARDADYQKIFDDILNLNRTNISREGDVARRQNKFQLYRQGLQTGSVDADQAQTFKEAQDRAFLEAGNRAGLAKTSARNSDEQARLDLLRQISGGLDVGSAAQSATRGMDLARQNAIDSAKGNTITGAFDTAGLLYQDANKADSIRRGRQLYQQLAGNPTPGSNSYFGS